jgi:hypothetical protein
MKRRFTNEEFFVLAQNLQVWRPDFCAKVTRTYPRFLWATLWITMFTSRQTRANAGVAGSASELISAGSSARSGRGRRGYGVKLAAQ